MRLSARRADIGADGVLNARPGLARPAASRLTRWQHRRATLAHFGGRLRELCRTDDEDGGIILAETSSALTLVSGPLRTRSYTDAHGRRLYAAAASREEFSEWAGSVPAA
ncbi:hypothetical protein [Streptantibioticus silvisoli]|uniref:Uncharacterized protein n=1 Tax=Streptantibioticus silvisoli TaxID=2705255 RepID=A0ABT6W014_9ACTN|nr:hypothetical protein [Streptantibioticus silvisoli]MDI5964088.1 hypothetical protein [Streptantibioticus silvisoli]